MPGQTIGVAGSRTLLCGIRADYAMDSGRRRACPGFTADRPELNEESLLGLRRFEQRRPIHHQDGRRSVVIVGPVEQEPLAVRRHIEA